MSEKRYEKKCELESCQKPFVAKISYAKFCSGKCKARWHREQNVSLVREHKKHVAKKSKLIQAQDKVIKTQARIIAEVVPDPPVPVFDLDVAGPGHEDLSQKPPIGSSVVSDEGWKRYREELDKLKEARQ